VLQPLRHPRDAEFILKLVDIYDHGPARWQKLHTLLKRLVAETSGLALNWEWIEYPEDYIGFEVEEWDVPSLRVRDGEGNPSLAVY